MRTNAKIYVLRAEDGTIKLGHSRSDPCGGEKAGVMMNNEETTAKNMAAAFAKYDVTSDSATYLERAKLALSKRGVDFNAPSTKVLVHFNERDYRVYIFAAGIGSDGEDYHWTCGIPDHEYYDPRQF